MKLAELIVGEARARGLTHFFGIPGGGAPLDLIEAGRTLGLQFVSAAHESSAAIMAAYCGELLGTAGLALSVKGIGAGNLVGGAVNAYFERLPVVCLCEAVPTSVTQRQLVQKSDHIAMFGPVTKFQGALRPQTAPGLIRDAVDAATGGRPGPVLLDLPSDLGQAECGPALAARPRRAPARASGQAIASLRTALEGARKPVVIAGADIVRGGAVAQLRTFVERIGAAVLVTMEARGVFPESHGRWAGVLMGAYGPNIVESELLARADLVVHVGVDAMMTHAPWKPSLPVVELAETAAYESLSSAPAVRIDGDLKHALEALSGAAQPGFTTDEVQQVRRKVLRCFARPGRARLAAQDVIAAVRAALPSDGALFCETGAFVCMLEHLWPVDEPGLYYGTSGGRTMGLMVPAVLGAKLAQPHRPMIGLGADGSLLMRLGELEVFARTGVAVPLVIIDDSALGTMKSRQKSRGLPDYGLDLHPVDLAQVARACGLNGVTVRDPEALPGALDDALRADRTTLIDARVDPAAYQDSFGPTIGVLGPA